MTEPIAYINIEERKLEWATPIKWETPTIVNMDKVPLYTAPPQREWVGLTYEDKKEIRESTEPYERETIIRLTETKLREKNGF